MDPCGEEMLGQLLTHIERGECELALRMWSDYRHQTTLFCDPCPYKEVDEDDDCCMCLEAKLRTLGLYNHDHDTDMGLLYAARKLDQFHQKKVLRNNSREREIETDQTKIRILVIDDEKIVRTAICMALGFHGYEVSEAGDGEEGVSLQNDTPFDIAIVDMMMPKKGGLDTIKELRSKFPELGILAISGINTTDKINHLELAKIYGATTTLQKPFEGEKLIDAINEVASASIM